jgi:signal transduction histidine kinase
MGTNLSFQRRLTLTMSLLLVFTTSALFIVNYQIERRILIDQIRQRALLIGKTLQLNLAQLIPQAAQLDLGGIPETERSEIREFIRHFGEEEVHLDMYSQNEGVHDLFFIDANNRVTIDYPAEKEGRILPPDERLDRNDLSELEHNEILSEIRTRGPDSILFLTFPVFRGGTIIGLGRIEMSMNSAVELLDRIKFWAIVSAAGLFVVAVLFAAYLSRTVTRPISELVQASARIGEGDLTVRLPETSQDEIGLLKVAFNRMVEGIVKLEETEHRIEKSELASQLAARMAHEIKNPLNSIGLIIDLMGDRYAPHTETDQKVIKKLSDDLKAELGRLNDIVEGFLRFAKPMEMSLRTTDLGGLLKETIEFIQPEAQAQKVRIDLSLDSGLPQIMADYSQLRHAMMNLLINAIQAMPEGGKIHVRAVRGVNNRIQIVVQDSGCGIPAENLPRLFDPYFTTKISGFGLGLSIVERIVQEHGGSIGVSSEPGKGSTFTIALPVGAAA